MEERAEEIQTALRSAQLAAPAAVAEAMGATVAALVAVIRELNAQIAGLEESLAERFDQHPVLTPLARPRAGRCRLVTRP